MSLQPKTSANNPILNDDVAILLDTVFVATNIEVRLNIGHVMDILYGLNIGQDFEVSVQIVIAELLNNIVEHGYAGTEHGQISLKVSLSQGRLRIETKDSGTPMPNFKAPYPPAPNLKTNRVDLPEGRFGWFLIRRLSENLQYQRTEGENRLSLFIAH